MALFASDRPAGLSKAARGILFAAALVLAAVISLTFVFASPGARLSRQLELGRRYLSQQDYQNAVISFTRAIEIDDRSESAYLGRAQAYIGLEEYGLAVADCTFIIETLAPDSTQAYTCRAQAYTGLGDAESAARDEARAAELSGESPGPAPTATASGPDTLQARDLVWSVEPQAGFEVVGMTYFFGQAYERSITEYGQTLLTDSVQNGSTVINDGRYIAMRDGLYGMLDLEGNWVVAPEYRTIGSGSIVETEDWEYPDIVYSLDSSTSVDETYDPDTGYYYTQTFDQNGTLVPKASAVNFDGPGYWFTWDASAGAPMMVDALDWTYVVAPQRDFPQMVGVPASDDVDGLYALYLDGGLVTDFVFEDARDLSDGLMAVCQNGKWGYVDGSGTQVIPCEYDAIRTCDLSVDLSMAEQQDRGKACAASCTEGYVAVCRDGQYALLDASGAPVIDFGVLEAVTEVHGGKMWAKTDGLWGVVDLTATVSP